MRWRRWAPWLAGTFVVALVWALPAALSIGRGSETVRMYGETWQGTYMERANLTENRSWEATVDVPVRGVRLLPSLAYQSGFRSGGDPGVNSDFDTLIMVYINGEKSYGWAFGHGTRNSESGTGTQMAAEWVPDEYEEADQSGVRVGKNTIRIEARTRLTIEEPGTTLFNLRLGPMRVATLDADTDHDGVLQRFQVASGLHSGILAGVLGAGATIGTLVFLRRWPSAPKD